MEIDKHFGRPGVCKRYNTIEPQITGYALQDKDLKTFGKKSWT